MKTDLAWAVDAVLNEKWDKDVEIKKTGEHEGKTVAQLRKEIAALKGKPDNKEKMGELLFALRAKTGFKKGKGATKPRGESVEVEETCSVCGEEIAPSTVAKTLPSGKHVHMRIPCKSTVRGMESLDRASIVDAVVRDVLAEEPEPANAPAPAPRPSPKPAPAAPAAPVAEAGKTIIPGIRGELRDTLIEVARLAVRLGEQLREAKMEVARLTNEYGDKVKTLMPLLAGFTNQEMWVDDIRIYLEQQKARISAPVRHYNKVVDEIANMSADLKKLIDDLLAKHTTPGRTLAPGDPILRFERPPEAAAPDVATPPQEAVVDQATLTEGFWGWLVRWVSQAWNYLRSANRSRAVIETELGMRD